MHKTTDTRFSISFPPDKWEKPSAELVDDFIRNIEESWMQWLSNLIVYQHSRWRTKKAAKTRNKGTTKKERSERMKKVRAGIKKQG